MKNPMISNWIRGAFVMAFAVLVTGAGAAEPEGFVPLFDGKSLDGWVDGNGEPMKAGGWVVEDGTLHLKRGSKPGNLLTARQYDDFILDWEWKIDKGGNNGVKYRVKKFEKGGLLGPEYQMIDDESKAASKPYYQTAAVYNILEPAADKPLKTPGEWNTSRVVANGTKLEHYLNGKLVAAIDTASDEWAKRKGASKFSRNEGFGEGAGQIMLTDHNDAVWYRNIRIKPLK
jgi:hypothetical protein